MNELRSLAILQARVYEFLGQQDEATLQAIVGGAAKLAVLHRDDARSPVSSVPREDVASRCAPVGLSTPSRDPMLAAHDLPTLTSEQERRIYLNATGLDVAGLRKTAKLLGLVGYSKLLRAELVNLLVRHSPDQAKAPTAEPKAPASSPSHAVDTSDTEQQATTHARPSTVTPSTLPTKSNAEVTAIATHLREAETEEEGAEYLRAQHLDRESLLAVAAELQLTRVERLSQTELEKRVLRQAIGARRKFAGLRRW